MVALMSLQGERLFDYQLSRTGCVSIAPADVLIPDLAKLLADAFAFGV
jgi:hypothetical protein